MDDEPQTTEKQSNITISSSPTLPSIRLNDRVGIFGGTGTGKSILAQVMHNSVPEGWWRLVVDITDSIIMPEALTFYDPDNIPWEDSTDLRFVPNVDSTLEDQINRLYLGIFYHGACWVWLDEANEISSAHRTAFGLRKVLLQGRKAFVGHVACTPRPADISKSIVTQSQYLITFRLIDFDDRQRMARYIGLTPDEFDEIMERLGEHEYLFYDVAMNTLYQVPAVPPEEVESILNPPIPDEEEVTEAPEI